MYCLTLDTLDLVKLYLRKTGAIRPCFWIDLAQLLPYWMVMALEITHSLPSTHVQLLDVQRLVALPPRNWFPHFPHHFLLLETYDSLNVFSRHPQTIVHQLFQLRVLFSEPLLLRTAPIYEQATKFGHCIHFSFLAPGKG